MVPLLAMITGVVGSRLASAPAARGAARLARPTMSLTRDGFLLAVLGDLHMEDDMSAHEEARADCLEALRGLSLLDGERVATLRATAAGELSLNDLELLVDTARAGELLDAHVVSLGDLGRKDIRNEPGDEGTSLCFELAKAYFDGFAPLPLCIVSGNHDVSGAQQRRCTTRACMLAHLRRSPPPSSPSAPPNPPSPSPPPPQD